MTDVVHNPHTLPVNDNVPGNDYAFCIELAGQPWFTAKGAMIAYYGSVQFEPLGRTSMVAVVASRFSSPLYANDWVLASGHGKVLLGDRGFDINSFDLDDGNLTIRASNLLAFEPGLELKQSIVPGFLTLLGTGKFLASSNGAVVFAEPPVRVDPQALVGWADCPAPSHHFDAQWMQSFLGGGAGDAPRSTDGGGAAVRLHRCGNGPDPVVREGGERRSSAPPHRVGDRGAGSERVALTPSEHRGPAEPEFLSVDGCGERRCAPSRARTYDLRITSPVIRPT
ncbi:uncharacterized protein (AIM24 family) [Rhodococcus sp. SORGH_AS303]|nr:uncharacterized protein (AIM24 family) [Rhodococcus sp. SORGH_AS_0303]